eukprot:jgi/Hompol1/5178/HPOL_001230-RA
MSSVQAGNIQVAARRKGSSTTISELEMRVRTVSRGPSLGIVTMPWFMALFVNIMPVQRDAASDI